MSNTEGVGGAQAKTGENRQALNRASGMNATIEAMGSKVRSCHAPTSTNNHWKDPSFGYGDDNINGYGDGNSNIGGRCGTGCG